MTKILRFPKQILIPQCDDPRFFDKATDACNSLINKAKEKNNLTDDEYADTMDKILELKMRIKFYLDEIQMLGR